MAIAAFKSTSLAGNRKPFLCRLHIVAVLLVLDGASGVVVVTGGCWHHGNAKQPAGAHGYGTIFFTD
jgi:hypothetical protein